MNCLARLGNIPLEMMLFVDDTINFNLAYYFTIKFPDTFITIGKFCLPLHFGNTFTIKNPQFFYKDHSIDMYLYDNVFYFDEKYYAINNLKGTLLSPEESLEYIFRFC